MSMGIWQIPDILANKIAAGEVVERPASVVKELIENSIDANSSWIRVDVEEAGLETIKVVDDGTGMSEADAKKAFLRHATSKITQEADLSRVTTLGFRGEALASIAAVSRMKIKTSQGEGAGIWLSVEGGEISDQSRSDARQGTEMIVEDLFYNTPARLKYMKTIHTELGHITDLLNRLSLSHPGIRFEAVHNGKQLFATAGTGDQLQVISQIYGMNVARKMIPVHRDTLDFSIHGYIAKPEVTRASRNYISTIVNGRFIKSMQLSQAIMKGYHTLLTVGRYPVVVLSIDMDPVLVDVNVHPAKLEVRFSKDKELFTAIEEAIRDAFRETTLIPEMEEKQPKPANSRPSQQKSMVFAEPEGETNTTITQQQIREPRPDMVSDHPESTEWKAPSQDQDWETGLQTSPAFSEEDVPTAQQPDVQERVPVMHPIGQVQGTYILAQNETGLYMIDQHAAQERIKFEQFRRKLGQTANEVQELLIPLTFDFSKQESIFIDHHINDLAQVGLFLEPFGNQTYIIRSHPNWFPKGYEEEVIREMIDQIMRDEQVDVASIREGAAALMSCKRSIKANHHLNYDDMFRLLEDLRATTDPFTCPHGRPVIIHFSSYELEKMFKRVM